MPLRSCRLGNRLDPAVARVRLPGLAGLCWVTPRLIHLPVHVVWLGRVVLCLSVAQRKALAANDCHKLEQVETRLPGFQQHYLNGRRLKLSLLS